MRTPIFCFVESSRNPTIFVKCENYSQKVIDIYIKV